MPLARSVTLLALAAAAVSAHATDAYSNLDPGPNVYSNATGYAIVNYSQGSQFTAVAGGTLTGFQLAVNQVGDPNVAAFSVSLYADNGSNHLGSLLGTYSGNSTGIYHADTTSALASVAAAGPTVTIANGGVYWLIVGTSSSSLGWNASNSATGRRYIGDAPRYVDDYLAAFSVQVAPTATPAPLAALPFALGLVKRRRKA